MLQYLIIILDDTSVSYCNYENLKTERRLISLTDLKKGILFAMKQNLMVQFVYPDYNLPNEYKVVIESIDNYKLVSSISTEKNANVIVFNGFENLVNYDFSESNEKVFVIRSTMEILNRNSMYIIDILSKISRLNIVITDIANFKEHDFDEYKSVLCVFKDAIMDNYKNNRFPQLNLITDRILLENMNNCNAGIENITLAPNGQFYVCPAFYFENENDNVGNPTTGLKIENAQLLKFEFAPICRNCDAYQCKRCVWLNRKTTKEVNTPSHEQCVVSHIERNESEKFLNELHLLDAYLDKNIQTINYLDPFYLKQK